MWSHSTAKENIFFSLLKYSYVAMWHKKWLDGPLCGDCAPWVIGYGLLSKSNGSLAIKHEKNAPSLNNRFVNFEGDACCNSHFPFPSIIFYEWWCLRGKIKYNFVQHILQQCFQLSWTFIKLSGNLFSSSYFRRVLRGWNMSWVGLQPRNVPILRFYFPIKWWLFQSVQGSH